MIRKFETLDDYIIALRRRKWLALSIALPSLLISVAVAMSLPPAYTSQATILIERKELLQDLLNATITSYAGERMEVFRRQVMTRDNIEHLIETHDLYPEMRKSESMGWAIEKILENTDWGMASASTEWGRTGTLPAMVMNISHTSQSPDMAQKVCNALVSMFFKETLKIRTLVAAETSDFFAKEAAKLQSRILELEQNLASFKVRNADKLPDLFNVNIQRLDAIEREMLEAKREIRSREDQQRLLAWELAQLSPTLTQESEGEDGEQSSLNTLQSQYRSLSAIYASEHPDVVRLRKQIAALEALEREGSTGAGTNNRLEAQLTTAQTELASARQRYSRAHPDVQRLERTVANLENDLQGASGNVRAVSAMSASDNPSYLATQARINQNDAELEALKARYQDLRESGLRLGERLTQTPEVEREFLALSRDYQQALSKYQETKAKQLDAQRAEALEVDQKGERLTLLESPQVPWKSIVPERQLIVAVGFILSLVAGVGAAFVVESMDKTLWTAKDVAAAVGARPLVVIPRIETPREKRRRIGQRVVIVCVLLVIACGIVYVNSRIMPVDRLWSMVQRELGF